MSAYHTQATLHTHPTVAPGALLTGERTQGGRCRHSPDTLQMQLEKSGVPKSRGQEAWGNAETVGCRRPLTPSPHPKIVPEAGLLLTEALSAKVSVFVASFYLTLYKGSGRPPVFVFPSQSAFSSVPVTGHSTVYHG